MVNTCQYHSIPTIEDSGRSLGSDRVSKSEVFGIGWQWMTCFFKGLAKSMLLRCCLALSNQFFWTWRSNAAPPSADNTVDTLGLKILGAPTATVETLPLPNNMAIC